MATIKSFTNIPQSKVLSKILPLESADMIYTMVNGRCTPFIRIETIEEIDEDDVLCWSLAALLGVIRETTGYTLYGVNNVYMSCDLGDKPWKLETEVYDNEIDTCYEMVVRLHELKML